MSKNIEWKKSSIDYTELDKLTPRVLASKNAASLGGKSQLESGKHNWQNSSGNRHEMPPMTPEHKFAFSSAGGKAQKGKPKPHSKDLAESLKVEWKCEKCGKEGVGRGNFVRYGHQDGTCEKVHLRKSTIVKHEKLKEHLPKQFTMKEAMSIAKELNITSGILNGFIKYHATMIYKGTNGSSIDLPIYALKQS